MRVFGVGSYYHVYPSQNQTHLLPTSLLEDILFSSLLLPLKNEIIPIIIKGQTLNIEKHAFKLYI